MRFSESDSENDDDDRYDDDYLRFFDFCLIETQLVLHLLPEVLLLLLRVVLELDHLVDLLADLPI